MRAAVPATPVRVREDAALERNDAGAAARIH